MVAQLPVIALTGPTASGKSRCALALAERLPVEIVSVDSAQVYQGMDIGTAKPGAAERGQVPHHLIDLVEPTAAYSAARFAQDATRAIEAIRTRGHIPLLVGGTLLYFKALREGLAEMPAADPAIRLALEREAQTRGWPALHDELARIDPLTAARLDRNDAQRVQRALEVFRVSGVPMSTLFAQSRAARPLALDQSIPWLSIALVPSDRAVLHERIEQRFRLMLAAGLVEELVALREHYPLSADLPSMRCVGYRQAWHYLDGDIDRQGLLARGVYATRQLAKRQLTWLRGMPGINILDCLDEALESSLLGGVLHALDHPQLRWQSD